MENIHSYTLSRKMKGKQPKLHRNQQRKRLLEIRQ